MKSVKYSRYIYIEKCKELYMLFRKLQQNIEKYLTSDCKRILLVDGARQVGKTYLIRYLGNKLFKNYIEINLAEDEMGNRYFKDIKNVDDFYLQLSMIAGDKMGNSKDTLVFLDEIQTYPRLMELLKFLQRDKRFKYIASGSLLGVTLKTTSSIPIGSIETIRMYPLDFEEFLIANNFGEMAISNLRNKFEKEESLPENIHNKVMDLFKKYLLVGGLPDSINIYISEKNIAAIRRYQKEIHSYYIADATKYEEQRKLKVSRIYNLLPSNMENKKKRVVIKDIENKKGSRVSNYTDEFDYLVSAGIALDVKAISTPVFPLVGNSGKNLLKLYLSDVGILTGILYQNNIRAILDDIKSINLGSVYESVVASELKAHGFELYYYDNRDKGEVDFLIDDYDALSVIPIEVKSGKDYQIHSALNKFVTTEAYNIKKAYVFSNTREIKHKGNITYLPIYYIMFLRPGTESVSF